LGAELALGRAPLPLDPPNLGAPLAGFGAGSAAGSAAVTSCRGCNCTGDDVAAKTKVKKRKALATIMNGV
jgi:hypothetical protein